MSETLLRESRRELAIVEGVRRFKLLACLEQIRHFVSGFFDLVKYFIRVFPSAQDEYNEEVVCGPDLIVSVRKVTHQLLGVKTTRQSGTRIWTRQQHQVEARLIRAIDKRNLLTDASEDSSAVSTLIGVSLHVRSLSIFKPIEISSRPTSLCSTALTLEPAVVGRFALGGFSLEAAGDGQRAFARELQQLLHSEFAPSSSFPKIGRHSVSQIRPGLEKPHVQKTPFPASAQLYETTWGSKALDGVRETHVFERWLTGLGKSGPNRGGHSARSGAGRSIARVLHTVSLGVPNVHVNGIGAPLETSADPRKVPGQKGHPKSPALIHLFAPISDSRYALNQSTKFATRGGA